jgi:hypothetical protein
MTLPTRRLSLFKAVELAEQEMGLTFGCFEAPVCDNCRSLKQRAEEIVRSYAEAERGGS